MQVPLVLTVIGRDRPGLIEAVARIVASLGGNWLESRMCRLGGEFAGIVRIRISGDREQVLREQLEALRAQGLSVEVCSGTSEPAGAAGRIATLELVGQDRAGIVRDITHALASQGVNVEELSTECTSAPMSGETLFKAQARLLIPGTCSSAELRKELERLAGNLLVEVRLEEAS